MLTYFCSFITKQIVSKNKLQFIKKHTLIKLKMLKRVLLHKNQMNIERFSIIVSPVVE